MYWMTLVILIISVMGVVVGGWMQHYLVVFLSVYSTIMLLPFIGMYYGLHELTA